MGKIEKRQKHSEHGQRIRTKIFIRTSSKKGSEKHESVKGGKDASGTGNSGTAEEGAITRTNYCKNEFVWNFFLREKNNGPYQPTLNLKSLNQLLPNHNCKMEKLKQVKELLKKGDSQGVERN